MEPVESNKESVVKKPKKRTLKIVLGVIAGLVLVLIVGVVFAVPAYVSSGSFRQLILTKANAAKVGAVDFADLSMGWLSGISISKLSYKDSVEGLSVAVKEFSTKPRYGALLTGNLSFGETVIDEPRVEIDVKKIVGRKTESPGPKTETTAGLPIGRIDLVVKNGDVKIKGGQGAVEVSQINTTLNLRPEGEQTSFEVGAKMVEPNKAGATESTINAKGNITPGKNWDMKRTSGDVTIEVNNLSLSQLESLLAIAGIDVNAKGMVSANVKAAIKNGVIENVDADVKGNGLEISSPQLKPDTIKTNVLEVAAKLGQQGDLINVETMTVRTDWLKIDANGAAPVSAATLEDFLKPDSKYALRANMECDIPALAAQLPKTMGLKEGTKLTGGKLVGSVATPTENGVKKLAGEVSIEGLAGMVSGKPVSIAEPIRAEALVTTEGKVLKFEKAGVTSSFAKVSCTGTTESFSYTAETDLAKMSGELGQFVDIAAYKLSGQATSKGQISNNKKATMVSAQTNIANLRASPTADIIINEPNAAIDVVAGIDKDKQVLLVKQMNANTSLGQYSIKDGRLAMGKESKEPSQLTAAARGVDLSRLQPYLVMAKAISKDVQLGGVAESDVTVSYKDGIYKFTTESTKITNLLVKAPGKEPFMQNPVELSLDAEANPATKTWKIRTDITSPDIKIKANIKNEVQGQTSTLQGDAQLDYDWHTLSGMLSAFMPTELVIQGKRKDAISFSSRYPTKDSSAMMANLNVAAKVGFDKAAYMGLHLGATNVDIKVDKGFLTIAPFTTAVNNGEFNFGGSADFKQKPTLFKTPGAMHIVKDVQLNDEMANKLLNKINPIFANARNVSGFANFECNKMVVPISAGALDAADVAGTISLTQVRMESWLLSTIITATGGSRDNILTVHPTPFTVNQGFVKYQDMQMDISNVPIIFSGIVPLDSNRKFENFSVTLPITGLGKVISTEDQTQQGRGSTLYVKGTPAKPELDIVKTGTEQAIKTGIELLLEKARKK
jgi:hypothetical protein